MTPHTKHYLVAVGVCLLTACTTQPVSHSPSAQTQVAANTAATAAIDPHALPISEALARDKNIARAYLVRREPDIDKPIYILALIFEGPYPKEAIRSAYRAFHQEIPNGRLELWADLEHDYEQYFVGVQPIYVRP